MAPIRTKSVPGFKPSSATPIFREEQAEHWITPAPRDWSLVVLLVEPCEKIKRCNPGQILNSER